MFGLEKDSNNFFEFDMEKDFKADPSKKTKVCKEVEEKIQELKDMLRKGMDSEKDFEDYGTLLRGYASLHKVVNRIGK
ncbi:MAG: hypothetical protein S4CHLAM37_12340 [Chlamydiia bacterium]|nr:hypothetical protein [Chlamydiia bacterium]